MNPTVTPAPLASEPFHATFDNVSCPSVWLVAVFHGSTLFGHGTFTFHDDDAALLVLVIVAS